MQLARRKLVTPLNPECMRVAAWVLCMLGYFATEGATQTIRCQLHGDDFAYGLFGTCVRELASAVPEGGRRVRFWPAEGDVTIVITSRPADSPPWRGYLFQQDGPKTKWGDSFEIARERTATGDRLVLRSMVGWVIVDEWRTMETGPSMLVFTLEAVPASAEDVRILILALDQLPPKTLWDRQDDRLCTNDAAGTFSLFCLLQNSARSVIGRYHHGQPAVDLVRRAILARWEDRVNRGHAIANFNNHPATTVEDLRTVLRAALQAARQEVSAQE